MAQSETMKFYQNKTTANSIINCFRSNDYGNWLCKCQYAVKGKALFAANNCGTCHKIDRQLVGPVLGPMVTMGHKEEYLIQ
ncbi:MAG: c-type cytochrome [Bacteroidota bacterium]